jgi:hypothetical protein
MTKFKAINLSSRVRGLDEACQVYLNTRKTRDALVQSVLKAKAALDEALRLSDEVWHDEVDDLVLDFSEQRLPGLEDKLDYAIERLLEQQAALVQMRAEYHRKSDAYCNVLEARGPS